MEVVEAEQRGWFVEGAIDLSRFERVVHPDSKEAGAALLFLGVVRQDERDGVFIEAIEYSAYAPMAGEVLRGIEERARERFGVLDLTIRHSLGRVAAGEISLLIIVHGRHRAEALNGLQYVIEEVKHTVPIWKKEILSDGSFVWVE